MAYSQNYFDPATTYRYPDPYATRDVYAESTRRSGGERGNQPPGGNVGRNNQGAGRYPGADPNSPGGVYPGGDNPLRRRDGRGRNDGYPRNRRRAAVQQTLDQLLSILSQNGGTDPGRLNYQMTDIARGTEAGQNAFDEYLASQGLSGSGVGAATHAAIGEAGQERRGQAIADENARAEERRRQDLLLTLQLILNPRLTRRGQDKAIAAAAAGGRGGNAGGYMGLLGNALGGASGTDWSKIGQNNNNDTGGLGGGETGYGDYGSPDYTGGTPDGGTYGNRYS